MYVYLGPDTFAGHPWPADEIAKGLVAELNLRKGDTVSKAQIIEYMAQFGMGPLWASDVAMVLRNVFGVTPIVYESEDGQPQTLLEELRGIVSEDEDPEFDFTEDDLAVAESKAIDAAFAEAKTEEEEAIIAALSMESIDTIAEIAALAEELTPTELDEVASVYAIGGEALVEDWYELAFRPHMVRFMEDVRRGRLAEALGVDGDALIERVRSDVKQQRRQAMAREMHTRARVQARAQLGPDAQVSALKKRTAHNLANTMQSMNKPDPLAQRAADDRTMAANYRSDKDYAGLQAAAHGRSYNQGVGQFKADNKRRAQAGMSAAQASPTPLPQDVAPQQAHPIKRGLSAIGRVAARAGGAIGRAALGAGAAAGRAALGAAGAAAGRLGGAMAGHGMQAPAPAANAPQAEPGQAAAPQAGAGQQVGQGAKSILGKIGGALSRVGGRASGIMRAKMRMRHPGLAHLMYGTPGDNERAAAQHMGLSHQYAQLGHELPGLDHQYQQAYLRNADRRYANPYRQRLARSVPNNPRFSR